MPTYDLVFAKPVYFAVFLKQFLFNCPRYQEENTNWSIGSLSLH